MGRTATVDIDCKCGENMKMVTHGWVNAVEEPHLVRQIERGEFHHLRCRCGKHFQVDKWFLYQDPSRRQLVHVFPRAYGDSSAQLLAQLEAIHRLCGLPTGDPVGLVFGIDGLMTLLREVDLWPLAKPAFQHIGNFQH